MHRGLADDVGRRGFGGGAVRAGQVPLAVHVRIDAAGDDDLAGGIDDAGALRDGDAAGCGDRGDGPAGDQDVMCANALWRHHRVAADHQIDHYAPLRSSGGIVARPGGIGKRVGQSSMLIRWSSNSVNRAMIRPAGIGWLNR